MTHQLTSTALYILLLPIFAVVAAIALGVLSLVFRSPWRAPEAEATPSRTAGRAATRAAPIAPSALEIPALPAAEAPSRGTASSRLREPELA